MRTELKYALNKASAQQLAELLTSCDADFIPNLSSRVVINDYAEKLSSKAMRFEVWADDLLVGLVAAYCNDQEKRIAYITSVSVKNVWMGQGIAAQLLKQCIEHAKAAGMRKISLEVASDNIPAIKLYKKCGFVEAEHNARFVCMEHYLRNGAENKQQT
jgi:ribosomal protein S18 acetylase RimI-like enzyme